MSSLSQRQRARNVLSDGDVVAALDIGSSKISCLIGRINRGSAAGVAFAGAGRQQSRGFRAGTITDIDALERAVRLAVEDAERQSGIRIERVRLGVTGASVRARLVTAHTEIGGREIGLRDVRRIQASALARGEEKGRTTLSAWPVAYRVDETEGVQDPSGMLANQVSILMCIVTAPTNLVRNLVECTGRAHLKVEAAIPSAIASGLGTLIDDERDNGAICIDMGAGATAMSVFIHGAPAWLDMIPAGGALVTSDLAQGLGSTFAAAERLKTIHGHADYEAPGLAERIDCPCLGDDGRLTANKRPREDLVHVIAPRLEETFELVKSRLDASDIKGAMPRRVILTGGASLIPGVKPVANRIFGLPVRLGRPLHAEMLGESLNSPAFSTAAGLLGFGINGCRDVMQSSRVQSDEAPRDARRMVSQAMDWLKENF
ncbi:MAG: cell division protein FtsA [Pseudomonadota bacterium]